MVDIHIRDISDPGKRAELVAELLAKHGRTRLVFELYSTPDSSVIFHGDYAGRINRMSHSVLTGEIGTEEDTILLKVTRYLHRERGRRGEHEWGVHQPDVEGHFWWVELPIKRLVNIYPQASVDPVVVKKEISA